MGDPTNIERFVEAQARNYTDAEAEISAGRKQTHWMWYIYPQLRSLGRSGTAYFYGITGLPEATAYLSHPVLGPRLVHMNELILKHHEETAEEILGPVDGLKLRSSATLFAAVPSVSEVFSKVLDVFYAGVPCDLTLDALSKGDPR